MSTFRILFFFILLFAGGLGTTRAQTFDISSGGTPTITGALGGSVTGSSSVTTNLTVIVNFGEVSPANTNNIVKVVVPVAIRSLAPYKVTASISGANNVNLQAVQWSDIGFGAQNLRRMGFLSTNCTNSDHIFYTPFNNDPSTNVSFTSAGRAAYPGDISDLSTPATILSGPQLSFLTAGRLTFNGQIFDAIFAITPQFYASGNASATITFTITDGPNVPC